jgi:hypothetical protein
MHCNSPWIKWDLYVNALQNVSLQHHCMIPKEIKLRSSLGLVYKVVF